MPPAIPPPPESIVNDSQKRIEAEAAQIVAGIRSHFQPNQRRHIAAYGRCLLLSSQPSQRQTERFIAALRNYQPYRLAAGRLNLAGLRQLQDEIARRVAAGA